MWESRLAGQVVVMKCGNVIMRKSRLSGTVVEMKCDNPSRKNGCDYGKRSNRMSEIWITETGRNFHLPFLQAASYP